MNQMFLSSESRNGEASFVNVANYRGHNWKVIMILNAAGVNMQQKPLLMYFLILQKGLNNKLYSLLKH
jgi:hypothetical protein